MTRRTVTWTVLVNRAAVTTLWAAVVAERLGFARAEALSPGRAAAGLNAQSKGRKLGAFKPSEEKPELVRRRKPDERLLVEVCGRAGGGDESPGGGRSSPPLPAPPACR
jgi:hypothetical protein